MSLPPNATIEEIEAKRREMGLDKPLPQQYLIWLADALHGDFGRSIALRREAGSLVASTLPATIQLAFVRDGDCRILGVGGGLLLFHVRGTLARADRRSRFGAAAVDPGISLGSDPAVRVRRCIAAFAVHRRGFAGAADPPRHRIFAARFAACRTPRRVSQRMQHLILPAVALGLAFSPTIMRVLRSSLFDIYHEDYIAQARLRGLSESRILLRHALKNASLPTLTLAGVQFGILFSGTLLVEVIYSYPGMGNLMVDAVRNADLPLIQAIGLTYCVVVLIVNTMVDGLYVVLNPKLRVR